MLKFYGETAYVITVVKVYHTQVRGLDQETKGLDDTPGDRRWTTYFNVDSQYLVSSRSKKVFESPAQHAIYMDGSYGTPL